MWLVLHFSVEFWVSLLRAPLRRRPAFVFAACVCSISEEFFASFFCLLGRRSLLVLRLLLRLRILL